jgi:2-iminoacetate synthase ThiH
MRIKETTEMRYLRAVAVSRPIDKKTISKQEMNWMRFDPKMTKHQTG